MDLVKIICGMLAVALFLGVLTCGSHDNRAAVAEEFKNETLGEPTSGVTGESLAAGENATVEQAAQGPAPPDSLILRNNFV